MQTFVTYKDWAKTASSLDNLRLGKQRLEALQTMRQLMYGEGGYPHHPVNKMWRGYEFALGIYGMQMCMAWHTQRRFVDTILFDFKREIEELKRRDGDASFASPPWRQDADVMRSHRSNLIRKERERAAGAAGYAAKFPKTDDNWPYLWAFVSQDDPSKYELMVSKADKKRVQDGERALPDRVIERVANW